MAYTKRYYIDQAFTLIGLANYAYDLEPEQLQTALQSLDSMMANLDGQGIRVGWSIPNAENQSSIDDEVDVPYQAREPIGYQLGLRIAPKFGKTLSREFSVAAKNAMNALMIFTAQPVPYQFPNTMPSGAGNKPWRTVDNPFLGPPIDPLLAGEDGPIDFGTLPPENGAQP